MKKNEKFREQKGDLAHLISREQKLGMDDVEERRDALVGRLKAGNRAAATELVDVYYEQLYMFLRRLGHSREAAEDLTQECFLQAWSRIGQLKNGQMLNGWLYGIAVNVSKLHWRRSEDIAAIDMNEFDVVADGTVGPEKADHYEQLMRLKTAVGRLPIKLKQAVVLHYMQYLTIAEAAEAVGVRQGTLKSRLNRALKFLKKRISSKLEN